MGSVYAERSLGYRNPRVALLANGEEETKGDQLVQETHAILKEVQTINFIGNIEGKDLLRHQADVVVCDGFVGNVALKTAEGVASMMKEVISREIKEIGGAPLLGVDGVVIIGHGRSNPLAIKHMIRTTMRTVESDVLGAIRRIGEQ
jgi:glycerol-3-phosphate acyltransferase PlsX